MKKVLFVATVTKHINVFHIPYLKWFKEQGYEVHVASNGNEKIEFCDKHYNLPFERFPLKKNNIKTYKELKKIINENKYEIIHCHTPVGGVLSRLAAKDARKNGTKVIYTAHGFHFYKGAPLLNWLVYYQIEKWLSKYTDCLITINQEDYERAKREFKIKQIKFVESVGIKSEKFQIDMSKKEKDELKRNLEIKKEDFVIIYVAELSKRKNQGMLINVVKKLIDEGKNIKVLLPGSDSLNGKYQEICKKLDIEDNVKFLGYRKDIPNLLNISDLYVSTSRQEGLALNIVEAMCMRLPVIATEIRGHTEVIKNNYNGFLVKNSNELEAKIKILMKDKKLAEKFINNGEKTISKFFINNVMEKMLAIYKEV